MEESEAGVDVAFQRGGRRKFDLVVGADGLHSNVRSLVFGEEDISCGILGYYVSIFTVPNHLQLDRSGVYYGTLGKKVGIFSQGDPREAKASFFFATEPLDIRSARHARNKKRICASSSSRWAGRCHVCWR